MACIRLEFVPIAWLALGWLGFDHLQLVFEPDGEGGAIPQDDWYVLEGCSGRSSSGFLVHVGGADGRTTLAAANLATGAELIRKIGTPGSRCSVVLPVEGDPLAAWDRMAASARAINAGHHPYWSIGLFSRFDPIINSSSVAASLLWEIGVDVHDHLPSGLVFSPGTDTLLSGERLHALPERVRGFDTLVGGDRDDELYGSDDPARLDKLYGGRGDDTFHWSSGINFVHGGQPGLPRRDDGYDTMDYRGAGRVEVRAGGRRLLGRRPDYVVKFSGRVSGRGGGTDILTSIERLLLDGITDKLAIGPRMKRIPRRLDIEFFGATQELDSGCLDLAAAKRGVTIEATGQDTMQLVLGTRRGDRYWQLSGVRQVIGTAFDDLIQMPPSMHVAEGGAGDDVIDARLVTPGSASAFCGYDAEIDGGAGDDILIACRGRTYARGGSGENTFIMPRLGESGARLSPELVIADAKPGDCLLVPEGMHAEVRRSKTRLKRVTGSLGEVADCGMTCDDSGVVINAAREAGDLVLTIVAGGAGDPRCMAMTEGSVRAEGPRTATVRLLRFQNGAMGISHSAFN